MAILITEAKPNSDDARFLLNELSQSLQNLTGDNGQSSFEDFDHQNPRNLFLMAVFDNKPVGCVALREIDFETCELKRMYSNRATNHIGLKLLQDAEARALILGYSKIILSTRYINNKAIEFYIRNGFKEIAPYGHYKDRPIGISICMGKYI